MRVDGLATPIRSPWANCVTTPPTPPVAARGDEFCPASVVPADDKGHLQRRLAGLAGVVMTAAGLLCGGAPQAAVAAPLAPPPMAQTVTTPTLRFHADGSFKILQLTDIHFQPEAGPEYAARYDAMIDGLLESEKPDLVVITGDVLYWSGRPMREYFDAAVAPMVKHQIPWAFTMGNHDAESWYSGRDIMTYLQSRPASVCQPGPTALGGSGNYAVEIQGPGGGPAAVLYMLDSHDHPERALDPTRELPPQLDGTHARPHYEVLERKYGDGAMDVYKAIAALSRDQMASALAQGLDVPTATGQTVRVTRDDFAPQEIHGYDWLTADQVRWYGDTSTTFTRNDNGVPLPSLMFFHIPLPEYTAAWNHKASGSRLEAESAQGRNTGMFAAIEAHHDVMGVFTGHDHVNDYVASLHGVALGYGRKTGLSVYGPQPLEHGGRVIVLHQGSKAFDTWIRTESGHIENKMTVPKQFDEAPSQ